MESAGRVLRIFEVMTKPGCAPELLKNFATTSAAVVHGKPGNTGYFFGQGIDTGENSVMFVSSWESLDAIKAHFGESWRKSYMPPGYSDLIETCSVRHFDMTCGWHI